MEVEEEGENMQDGGSRRETAEASARLSDFAGQRVANSGRSGPQLAEELFLHGKRIRELNAKCEKDEAKVREALANPPVRVEWDADSHAFIIHENTDMAELGSTTQKCEKDEAE